MKNKKLFLLSVTSILMFSIVGCGGNQNSNSNDQTNNPTSKPEIEMVDLSEYRMNITDAKNIGISRKNKKSKSKSYLNKNSSKDYDTVNTVVKTVTSYKEGTTEVVDQDINVTFTKIDTTVTTKTVDSVKNYLSYGATQNEDGTYKDNAKITISSIDGFEYSVYDEANPEVVIYDKVVDNSEVDLDKNPGVLELGGLKHNYSYTVKYHGVGEETTITESEIGAEIDKIFVYNQEFTFISYVPLGTSLRPDDDELKILSDGQSEYDSVDIYSSNDRQSFVVNNLTGSIYKIKDFYITKIELGVIYTDTNKFPYILVSGEDITFKPLFTNESLEFSTAFRDRYGNSYVFNQKLSFIDEANKVIFFKEEKDFNFSKYYYFLNDNYEVVRMPYIYENDNGKVDERKIEIIKEDHYEEVNEKTNCNFISKYPIYKDYGYGLYISDFFLRIENGKLLFVENVQCKVGTGEVMCQYDYGNNIGYFENINNQKSHCGYIKAQYHFCCETYLNYIVNGNSNTILFFDRDGQSLYYKDDFFNYIIDEMSKKNFDYKGNVETYNFAYDDIFNFNKIDDGLEVNYDWEKNMTIYTKFGLNGNTYYDIDIVKNNNSYKPVLHNVGETYFSEDDLSYTFKPINR